MRRQVRQISVFGLYAIILAALTGCAGSGEVVYRPVIRPDMTYAAAVHHLQNAARSGKIVSATGPFTPVRSISDVIVNENGTVRWEFDPEPRHPRAIDMSLLQSELDFTVDDWGPAWKITLPDFMLSGSLPELQKVADDLYLIQQKLKNLAAKQNQELALFEPIAAKYRSLEVKPQISEEQRKLVVQANAQSQQQRYLNAIDLYEKAIALDPVSYPAAYFNLALLSAQENAPRSAIYYMKHYLLLVPDAPDARSAQDKIYEWEMLMPESSATTTISTDPPDALLEAKVSDSARGWTYLGRAPKPARFGHGDAKDKSCLIRASKPGYATQEKSFPFESLPAQVHIPLQESGSGQDTHGYLGINFVEMTEELAKSSGSQTGKGVVVKELAKGSPGDRAGLQPGDVILGFADEDIDEAIDLPRMAASTPIGQAVELKILRKGQTQTVAIKIGKLPE